MATADSSLLITLGYGKRSIDDVIELLRQHGVRFLVDVRSAPYSRYQPDFSHDTLRVHLERHAIRYLFLGEELGGRPDDPRCYDESGRVDYDACKQRPAFRHGIERLRTAWEGGHRVALLCSESRPENCHRSKLLGAVLTDDGIDVLHLDEDGTPLGQDEVMRRLLGDQLSLFTDPPTEKVGKSRGRYRPVAES